MPEGVNSGGIRLALSEVMCPCVGSVNELKDQRVGKAALQVRLLLSESMRKPRTTVLHFPAPLPLFLLLLLPFLLMHMQNLSLTHIQASRREQDLVRPIAGHHGRRQFEQEAARALTL